MKEIDTWIKLSFGLISINIILIILSFFGGNSHQVFIRIEAEEFTVITATTTAYSSSVDETDDTPTTTAHNTQTRDGVIANNCLPFGTKVMVEDKEYVVEDRMNRRYGCDVFDIWMNSKEEALNYGKRELAVRIIHDN